MKVMPRTDLRIDSEMRAIPACTNRNVSSGQSMLPAAAEARTNPRRSNSSEGSASCPGIGWSAPTDATRSISTSLVRAAAVAE